MRSHAPNESPIDPIVALSASDLAERIRSGEFSATEVAEVHIDRIQEVNPKLNALVLPLFDEARAQAAKADAATRRGEAVGPLHGVPPPALSQRWAPPNTSATSTTTKGRS